VDTEDFINTTAPEDLYLALEPVTPLASAGACAVHDPRRFPSPRRQQAAFDGEATDPTVDYPAAAATCQRCPLLAACRKYADDSCDEHTFLAGLTAAERADRRLKKTEVAKRQLQVAGLRALGAPTSVIANLVGRDPSLIRRDIRILERQDLPATA
jgi:hypothetical protein